MGAIAIYGKYLHMCMYITFLSIVDMGGGGHPEAYKIFDRCLSQKQVVEKTIVKMAT